MNEYNEFDWRTTEIRNSEERIASKLLMDALAFSRRGDYDGALAKIEDIKSITPNYFEVYRISAFIKASDDNLLGADDDYKTALELEPDDIRTLYYYARFLIFKIGDTIGAEPLAYRVFELRPHNSYTNLLKAQLLEGKSDFKGAVDVLIEYVDKKATKTSKEMRIAVSELLSMHQNWAQKLMNYNQDYQLAADKLLASIGFYEEAYKHNNIDKNMSDKLSKSMFMLMAFLPKNIAENYVSKVASLHAKYADHIALSEYYGKFVQKMYDLFELELNKSYIASPSNEYRSKGIVTKYYSDKDFVFIDCNGESVFAHKSNFTNIYEWSDVDNGLVVVFDKLPSTIVGKLATAKNIEVALYEKS